MEDYPHAVVALDSSFPKYFGLVLETTISVDYNHAHNEKICRSLTDWMAFVGSTPVTWQRNWEGSVASSTYAAAFSNMRAATKETTSLCYMLSCLGCNIPEDRSCPTKLFNDNFSVAQNCQNPTANLSKKYVATFYHIAREAVAAGVIKPYWIKGGYNMSNILTK